MNIEDINKEFDEYQKSLDIRNQRLKLITRFEVDSEFDELLDSLRQKDIKL